MCPAPLPRARLPVGRVPARDQVGQEDLRGPPQPGGQVHAGLGQRRIGGVQLREGGRRVRDLPQVAARDASVATNSVPSARVSSGSTRCTRAAASMTTPRDVSLYVAHGLRRDIALQVERRMRDEIAQHRPVSEAASEDVGDQARRARGGGVESGVQGGGPVTPGLGGPSPTPPGTTSPSPPTATTPRPRSAIRSPRRVADRADRPRPPSATALGTKKPGPGFGPGRAVPGTLGG